MENEMIPGKPFKPMLSAAIDTEEELKRLRFPVWCSPKIDGIRVVLHPELGPVTRSLKPVPNHYIRGCLSSPLGHNLDGEICVGKPNSAGLFNRTQSAVMSEGDEPHGWLFLIFDTIEFPNEPYSQRFPKLADRVKGLAGPINVVAQYEARDVETILRLEQQALDQGYEGLMIRAHDSIYKYGRSTLREQHLLKLKRFKDDEAKIIGFEPLERNTNPQTRNALGLASRSSHKAGKVADDLLGRLSVTHSTYGQFYIGSGFDVSTREEIWQNQPKYLGKRVSFKYLPHGMKDKPRHPIFKGIRHD